MVHRFADFEFDELRCELRRAGRAVSLKPRNLELLAYLLRNPDRLVGYEELIREVWHGTAVSRSALAFSVSTLRRALGDDRSGCFLTTVRGRGYRWVAVAADGGTHAAGARADGVPEPGSPALPFVGRERELLELELAWNRARSGRACISLLAGEPGIGKTRLVQEHAERARAGGACVLIGLCSEDDAASPFWPWIQIVRSALDAELGAVAPVALRRWAADAASGEDAFAPDPARGASAGGALGAARFRLFDAVAQLAVSLARRRPVVLVLEDLHAADPASLRLLAFLARATRDARISLMGTCRSRERESDPALSGAIAELLREPCTRILEIGPLSREAVRRFVETAVSGAAPEELAETIFARTEGHPLFVAELVRLATRTRLPSGVEAQSSAVEQELAAIPGGVRDAIRARIRQTSAACRALLETASVLGRELAAEVLHALDAESSPIERLAALDEALAARLLETTHAGAGLRFCHALVREVLYHGIALDARAALHRRAGLALEAGAEARGGDMVAEIARHLWLAGPLVEHGRVVGACARAARSAASALAFEAALAHYERALEVLEQRAPDAAEERCDLLLEHGELAAQVGEADRARASVAQALALARAIRSPERIARVAAAYPGLDHRAITPTAEIALLEEALGALPDAPGALRVELLARLSNLLHWSERQERRIAAAEQALAMARGLEDPRSLGRALMAQHLRLWTPDQIEDRLHVAAETLAIARASGDRELLAFSHQASAMAHFEKGERSPFLHELDALRRLLVRTPEPLLVYYRCWLGLMEATQAFMGGRFDEVERMLRGASRLGRFDRGEQQRWVGRLVYSMRREQGRLAELEPLLPRLAQQDAPLHGWRATLVLLQAALGRAHAAREEFALLASGDWLRRRDAAWLPTVAMVAQVCALVRDRARARSLLELLLPYRDQLLVLAQGVGSFGSVARHLGLLHAALGEWDAAERDYERALEIESRWSSTLWIAQAQCELACVLLARGAARDRARARAILDEGRRHAERLGLRPLLWITADSARRLDLRARSLDPDRGAEPLTKP